MGHSFLTWLLPLFLPVTPGATAATNYLFPPPANLEVIARDATTRIPDDPRYEIYHRWQHDHACTERMLKAGCCSREDIKFFSTRGNRTQSYGVGLYLCSTETGTQRTYGNNYMQVIIDTQKSAAPLVANVLGGDYHLVSGNFSGVYFRRKPDPANFAWLFSLEDQSLKCLTHFDGPPHGYAQTETSYRYDDKDYYEIPAKLCPREAAIFINLPTEDPTKTDSHGESLYGDDFQFYDSAMYDSQTIKIRALDLQPSYQTVRKAYPRRLGIPNKILNKRAHRLKKLLKDPQHPKWDELAAQWLIPRAAARLVVDRCVASGPGKPAKRFDRCNPQLVFTHASPRHSVSQYWLLQGYLILQSKDFQNAEVTNLALQGVPEEIISLDEDLIAISLENGDTFPRVMNQLAQRGFAENVAGEIVF